MRSSTLLHDGEIEDYSQPRSGGPTGSTVLHPAQKLEHLAYEAAASDGSGGAYLREQGSASSAESLQ